MYAHQIPDVALSEVDVFLENLPRYQNWPLLSPGEISFPVAV